MLIGLGLGPGDPELLTLRAVRLLSAADRVYVPGGIAQMLVAPYREATVLEFPMTGDETHIRRCLEAHADRIAREARSELVVLALIGDPNFFSTFTRLCTLIRERHPEVQYETVPGVSAITAFASVAGISLSDGFVVMDGKEQPRSRILLKVTRPKEAAAALRAEGFGGFVLVERMYMDGMRIYRGEELPETSHYLSILYARENDPDADEVVAGTMPRHPEER
ncbi:MAG: cobalt-factor II C(20)-methyltransferase [Methanoregulaceae archaeon]|jgi:precorrin-2/cobalt-factor-2 C20-methyltransferase|nr:cobalt-factor II C(20)-methyltransferase [Methanoregulaceae archaeon]